jgi:hypothetical protein
MPELMDFATGCLTILLCVLLVPLFFLVFKLTLPPRDHVALYATIREGRSDLGS